MTEGKTGYHQVGRSGVGDGEFEFLLVADPYFAEIQGLFVGRDFRISRHREYDREFQNFGERIVGVETSDGPFGSGGEIGCVYREGECGRTTGG